MKNYFFSGLTGLMLLTACTSTKPIVESNTFVSETPPAEEPQVELTMGLEPLWAPKEGTYKASHTQSFDLLHTSLDLRFNWEKQQVIGKADLRLKPYFYTKSKLEIDAKGFELHKVALKDGDDILELKYTYDGKVITIDLGKEYARTDTLDLFIDYTANPTEVASYTGEAITSDQGLYFINHDGSEEGVPRQIWTQGEPQASSCWFPTIDWPNERTSQEVKLTIKDEYISVSNGKLISSEKNYDGTRTDIWRQEKPHAPYLFALVVGEFVKTTDTWRDMELSYILEPDFAPYAKTVFSPTPEMLEYYSNALGVDYPWDKYAQIVVREFVSGAMENTGCVIFYDALNQDNNQHLDENHEDIIAHELIHHWFGDLVTMESFANLPLNESFATYGEYLWFRHKYGQYQADYHADQDLINYMAEAATKREPLIRYKHDKPDDMFDAHSYQKGGRVMRMLHELVGEEAFFASLKLYLTRNAYTAVEIDELRLAFEDVTGMDLKWFFEQWFMRAGHPELEISYEIKEGEVLVGVEQAQDLRYSPIYKLPVSIQVTGPNGEIKRYPVVAETQDTTFSLKYDGEVANVIFDADQILLAEKFEEKTWRQWLNQLTYGQNYKQKHEAITYLTDNIKTTAVLQEMRNRLKDDFWGIRLAAIEALTEYDKGDDLREILKEIMNIAANDPDSRVRSFAARYFADENTVAFLIDRSMGTQLDLMLNACKNDSSYNVRAATLQAMTYRNPQEALQLSYQYINSNASSLMGLATLILMQVQNPNDFDQILKNAKRINLSLEKMQIIQSMGMYLSPFPETQQDQGIAFLIEQAGQKEYWWLRMAAVQSLQEFTKREDVKELIKEMAEKETNENVKGLCEQIVSEF